MPTHHALNYLEFPTRDLPATQRFFQQVFGWTFQDYGPEYTAFDHAQTGMDGGFFHSEQVAVAAQGAPLVIFYSADLEASLAQVQAAGGEITQAIFAFPGGRRFHFTEPGGNELAIWSE